MVIVGVISSRKWNGISLRTPFSFSFADRSLEAAPCLDNAQGDEHKNEDVFGGQHVEGVVM